MFRFITTTALFSLVFMMPVMVSTVAPYSDFSASAFAEEKEKEELKLKEKAVIKEEET